MVTTEQIYEYFEKLTAEDRLSGNQVSMKQVQSAAGMLVSAAEAYGDKETARRFRILAARAANKYEQETEKK